jgi:Family of unknown function (DUF6476)
MAAKVDRSLRALKILVVVMGVLLVLGTGALVAAIIAKRGVGPATNEGIAHALRSITLPPGAQIGGTELSGDRILVHVKRGDGGETLYLFSARDGAPVGTIELHAKPESGEAQR